RLADALAPLRVAALLIGALGGTAVLLAMTGLYGVVNYAVKRRSFEIGVRMALGATRTVVMGLILRESFLMVGIGSAAGGIAAVIVTRTIRTILSIGQNPVDAVAFASVFVVLLATSALASLSPARRAAVADPIMTLRHD